MRAKKLNRPRYSASPSANWAIKVCEPDQANCSAPPLITCSSSKGQNHGSSGKTGAKAEREAIKRDQKVVELGVAHRERPGDIERGRKSGLEAGHEKKTNPSRVGLKPVSSLARRTRQGCVHAKVPPMTALREATAIEPTRPCGADTD